jgi:hypothetical protein
VTEFTLAGNGQFLFAVDADNRLLRIEAATGTAATWLEPFPEFRDASAGLADRDPASCPLVCYSGFEPLLQLGRGSLFIFSGRYWTAGWRVRVGDVERPLQLLSGESAWFQVPDEAADGRQPLVVFHPQHPLRISATAQVTERYISCLGALHQGFDRPVSAQDAAYIGEIVHVFLTGLAGVEAVAEGVPNPAGRLIPVVAPPALGGSGAVRSLFFGLAPGLIGMQQLDLWMLGPVTAGQRLFEDAPSAPNCEIPPATP